MEPNISNSQKQLKPKIRETFSVPLKIPLQTDVLNAAFKKYYTERGLDGACSKTDFLLFVLRQYLNDQTDQLKQQLSTLSQKLGTESSRIGIDTNGSHVQQFERALTRRMKAGLSTSREDFICQLFRYTRSKSSKDQLLND